MVLFPVKDGAGDSEAKWTDRTSPVKTPLAKWYDLFERTPTSSAKPKRTKSASAIKPPVQSDQESDISVLTDDHPVKPKTKVKRGTKERPKTCGAAASKQRTVKAGRKLSKKMKEAFYDVIDVSNLSEENIRPKNKRGLVERDVSDCVL